MIKWILIISIYIFSLYFFLISTSKAEPRTNITKSEHEALLDAAQRYYRLMTETPFFILSNNTAFYGWTNLRTFQSDFKIKKEPFQFSVGLLFSSEFPKGISLPLNIQFNFDDSFALLGVIDPTEVFRGWTNIFRLGLKVTL